MRRIINTIIVLSLFYLNSYGQTSNRNQTLSATYEAVLIHNDIVISQTSSLYYNNKKSIFSFFKSNAPNIRVFKLEDSNFIFTPEMHNELFHDTLGNYYIKDFTKNSLALREFSYTQAYLSKEPCLPKMDWNIIPDSTKKIGNYDCIMATESFRGRNYTAWFTPDIPVSDGPWKFYGLPGLILDVYDSTGTVRFTVRNINIPASFQMNLNPGQKGKKVDWEIFKKADAIEAEKLKRKILASQIDRNANMEVNIDKYKFIELDYD
ncbi:MAG: GLPGLI family protein [Chitinophagaceae bacterium]|jgi:GLPGLI family protein|nr:GLPGLI family protein [Chitinophagaceae bacterium]OQY96953.1 MAG: hypothetical protein B6D37_00190 [Sphingobacteriales bacterium UTBCD1]